MTKCPHRGRPAAGGITDADSAVGERTPFFIVGSGRSGTTLLRLMIAGHSAIDIPPETWFAFYLVDKFSLRDELAPHELAQALKIITEDYRWSDMGIPADVFRRAAAALVKPKLVDLLNLIYHHHLTLSKKRRFGDKTPIFIEIVPQLSILYPGAKFIHLVRDGRDVAISYIDLSWHDGCRCYEREFWWTRSLRFREEYRKSDLDKQILDIRYEDLLTDAEAAIRKICVFLGEEFEPAMLEVSGRIDRVPERERVIHPKLNEPLSTDAIGRWRTALSGFECFIMEACLQRNLRRWGYLLRFSSLAWRPVLVVAGWMLFGIGPLLAKGIPYLQRRHYLRKSIYI